MNVFSRTEIKPPATGIIQKSNRNSFFLKFHLTSEYSKILLKENPKFNDKPVCIIQIVILPSEYMIAEIVNVEDGL